MKEYHVIIQQQIYLGLEGTNEQTWKASDCPDLLPRASITHEELYLQPFMVSTDGHRELKLP